MSEENKTVELNDEELKQVSGGARFYLYEVSVGDVFLDADGLNAYIVKNNVTDNGNDPCVPTVKVDLVSNTWRNARDFEASMSFLNNRTYSQALSGTLNHLLN